MDPPETTRRARPRVTLLAGGTQSFRRIRLKAHGFDQVSECKVFWVMSYCDWSRLVENFQDVKLGVC